MAGLSDAITRAIAKKKEAAMQADASKSKEQLDADAEAKQNNFEKFKNVIGYGG